MLREVGHSRWRQQQPEEAQEAWTRSAALFRSIDASLDAAAVEELLGAIPGTAAEGAWRANGEGRIDR